MEKFDFRGSEKDLNDHDSVFISFNLLRFKKLIEHFSRVFNVKIKRILEIYLELIHCLGEDAI